MPSWPSVVCWVSRSSSVREAVSWSGLSGAAILSSSDARMQQGSQLHQVMPGHLGDDDHTKKRVSSGCLAQESI